MSNSKENKYYIYAWYYKNTGEIFHIGKGCAGRWKDTKNKRNEYFKNVIAKEKNNVDVRKIAENLYQEDAWELEKYLIKFYKSFGWCKTNFHEGGRGGNHGNYSENMRKKISEYRTGLKMTKPSILKGKKLSEDHKEKISASVKNAIKNMDPNARKSQMDKIKKLNKERYSSEDGRKKLKSFFKPKYSEKWRKSQSIAQSKYKYKIYDNDILVFESIHFREVEDFCTNTLKFSRTIFWQIVDGNWKPKFKKHQHLKNIKIIIENIKFNKSVSTNPDECKGVE